MMRSPFVKPLIALADHLTHFARAFRPPNAAPLSTRRRRPPRCSRSTSPRRTATNRTARGIDMSPLALFMKADIVVKAVMGILLFASFWSWAIIFGKWMRVGSVRAPGRQVRTAVLVRPLARRSSTRTLQARNEHHPMAHVFVAGMREWKRSFETGPVSTGLLPSVKDRIHRVMNVTIGREITRLESSLGFLATVGVNATFIGLFGTVWGIMNSFRQIAASHDTSLAVVAPGIAEALFATAMGLVAAIPASVAYNHLSASVGRIAARLEGFSDEFAAILSRQLDEKAR